MHGRAIVSRHARHGDERLVDDWRSIRFDPAKDDLPNFGSTNTVTCTRSAVGPI
jgi:hypothetical protein